MRCFFYGEITRNHLHRDLALTRSPNLHNVIQRRLDHLQTPCEREAFQKGLLLMSKTSRRKSASQVSPLYRQLRQAHIHRLRPHQPRVRCHRRCGGDRALDGRSSSRSRRRSALPRPRRETSAQFYTVVNQLHKESRAGRLQYKRVNINKTQNLEETIELIGAQKQWLDGLIAGAGIIQVTPAIDYEMEDACKLMATNFSGLLATANACAKQMLKYKSRGSICLIASMSGLIANKGLLSLVYDSSKAAVIQLARSLSMEWSKVQRNEAGGIRVNALSPGYVFTPMVLKSFEEAPVFPPKQALRPNRSKKTDYKASVKQ